MDISELYDLPTDEKLEIVGKLWDNIVDSGAPIVLSPQLIAEVERRRAELEENPTLAIDRKELWKRVNEIRNSRPGSYG